MKITERIGAAWRALNGRREAVAVPQSGGFAGGAVGRLTASLATWSGSVNADLDGTLVVLRARARALAANNEHGRRFMRLVEENVVGRRNPKLQVRVMRAASKGQPAALSKSINDAVEWHWERWGRTADVSGRHRSLYSLLRTSIKGVARDGEALLRKVRDKRMPYGFGLQLLEADRLDETINARMTSGNVIRQGVELDSMQRAVAYYIKTQHPGDAGFVPGRPGVERVPAGEMYHLFLPERAEQVRGYTWMHAVILRGSIIHRFEEAAVVAAEIGASKVAALERAEEAPDVIASMADEQVGGSLQMNVQAGELFELPAGVKLNSWNPEYPHANFDSFLKACLRGLASGLNVAAHNLTGDMTDVNYSSARIAEMSERESWMGLQDWLIDSLMLPMYEDWLDVAMLQGAITFIGSGDRIYIDKLDVIKAASRFQGRRWAWVDPAKEADAQEKLLANKLTSRTRIAAEQGEEFEDLLDELAQEQQLIDAAGLSPAPPSAPAPTPADEAVKILSAARSLAQDTAPPHAIHVAPVINNAPPSITLNQAAARTEISMQPPVFSPEIRNEITMPDPQVNVEAHFEARLPEQPAPVVEVNVEMPDEMKMTVTSLPDRKTTTDIKRNGAGEIVESAQLERDA